MTSVEDNKGSSCQENLEGVGSGNRKKGSSSKSQNGGQNRGRDREPRRPAKDGSQNQRVDAESQNDIDDDDDSELVPPEPVAEPSMEENNVALSVIRGEIDDLEQKVVRPSDPNLVKILISSKFIQQMIEMGLL